MKLLKAGVDQSGQEKKRPEGQPHPFEPTTIGLNIQGSDSRGGRGDSPSSTDGTKTALKQDEKAGSPEGSATSFEEARPAAILSSSRGARAADGQEEKSTSDAVGQC